MDLQTKGAWEVWPFVGLGQGQVLMSPSPSVNCQLLSGSLFVSVDSVSLLALAVCCVHDGCSTALQFIIISPPLPLSLSLLL